MKHSFLTVLLFSLLFTTATAQYFPVDTARLNKACIALEKEPQNTQLQQDFFNAFPTCWDDFNSTYKYSDKEGYDLAMYSRWSKPRTRV